MNFKNLKKYIDLAVLSMVAASTSLGNTNLTLLGIIIYLAGTVLTRDSK